MIAKLQKQQRVGRIESIVLLIPEGSKIRSPYLSHEEVKYIEKRLSDKEKQVALNQFNRWVFIQVIAKKYKGTRVLEEIRKAAYSIHQMAVSHKIKRLMVLHSGDIKEELLAFSEGLMLSNYQFLKYFTKPEEKEYSLREVGIISKKVSLQDIEELHHLILAIYQVRDLVNEPNSFLTATQLARAFQRMGKEAGFRVEVLEKGRIESLKMGGLLAVNLGSIEPPTFSILEWKPKKPVNRKPLILVGKGVVYDTGGLSLKPTNDSMNYMKTDMSGAAAVAGAMYAVAKNKLPVHVIGLVPSTDNRPSGNAYAPGDVIRMYDGTTVEMLNADAEGRMILADALGYAKKFKPQLVITIATLTGAAARAIGKLGIVAMGNANRKVFNQLKASGDKVYERLAEFPFWDEYAEMIKSDIADIQNTGGNEAGAITAGKFLEHFTDYPFIHLDIAGVAFIKKQENYRGKGGTGVGVRLLYEFIRNQVY
jgi:leucyl aminopeptidase